jgi:hypothetical protein
MSRVQGFVWSCVAVGACFVGTSSRLLADDGAFVIRPAVYRTTEASAAGATTQLVNHRYRGGGFSIGIYSGPRWGYGGYGGGYYYRPYSGYGYSGWSYPRGFYPGGYYYSSPGYGYYGGYGSNYYGYYGCY